MAHISGANLYVEFAGVQISGDQRSLSFDESINIIDTTAGADTDESHVTGTRSATISLTVLYAGTDGSAAEQVLYAGNSGTLTWGPEGTASGKPKYSCVATCDGMSPNFPFDGEVTFDASFTKNGDWLSHWNKDGSTF